MTQLNNELYKKLNKEFVDEFINIVNKKCKPIRKPKYSTEYYLYHIMLVLTDLQKWESLKLLHINNKPNHYKTIQDKHIEWSRKNIYEITYKTLNKKYHQNTLKNTKNLTLFIDSTNVYNKNGNQSVGYGQNPKKQESRISAICDENLNIYSLTLIKSINRTPTKKTLPHDSKTIDASLENLFNDDIKYRTLNLVGDKGYTSTLVKRTELKETYDVNLVYPHRKNQKIRTPKKSKILLKKRYVIENVFSKLKSFDRICLRKDKLECTFISFTYLAAILTFKK